MTGTWREPAPNAWSTRALGMAVNGLRTLRQAAHESALSLRSVMPAILKGTSKGGRVDSRSKIAGMTNLSGSWPLQAGAPAVPLAPISSH